MDRLVIEISGALPEEGKYGILDAAERAVKEFISQFGPEHKITLTGSVRSVRPGKKGSAPSTNGAATDNVHVSSSEAGHG